MDDLATVDDVDVSTLDDTAIKITSPQRISGTKTFQSSVSGKFWRHGNFNDYYYKVFTLGKDFLVFDIETSTNNTTLKKLILKI